MTTQRRRPYRDSPVHDHGSETFVLLALCVVMVLITGGAFVDAIRLGEPAPTPAPVLPAGEAREAGWGWLTTRLPVAPVADQTAQPSPH